MNGHREELRPHPREGVVVALLPFSRLRVGGLELDVFDTRLRGLAPGVLDEVRRGVGAQDEAVGTDELGEALGGLAEPAADVDASPSFRWRETLE